MWIAAHGSRAAGSSPRAVEVHPCCGFVAVTQSGRTLPRQSKGALGDTAAMQVNRPSEQGLVVLQQHFAALGHIHKEHATRAVAGTSSAALPQGDARPDVSQGTLQ